MEGARVDETKQILIAIAEIKTDMKNMGAKLDEISKMPQLLSETDQRAKAAHNRIDDLKTDFLDKLQNQKEDSLLKMS